MREIKFRAWDKLDNKMEYKDWYDLARYGWIRHEYWEYFIFMQSIGLKDKNGKEIYEGDIVELTRGSPYCKQTKEQTIVVFEEAMFKLRMIGDIVCYWTCSTNPKNKEVIGNIYENKELLK